jgi:hypothetical protein
VAHHSRRDAGLLDDAILGKRRGYPPQIHAA